MLPRESRCKDNGRSEANCLKVATSCALWGENCKFGMLQKEVVKRSSRTFSFFVTPSDAFVTFCHLLAAFRSLFLPSSFCLTPFAAEKHRILHGLGNRPSLISGPSGKRNQDVCIHIAIEQQRLTGLCAHTPESNHFRQLCIFASCFGRLCCLLFALAELCP